LLKHQQVHLVVRFIGQEEIQHAIAAELAGGR